MHLANKVWKILSWAHLSFRILAHGSLQRQFPAWPPHDNYTGPTVLWSFCVEAAPHSFTHSYMDSISSCCDNEKVIGLSSNFARIVLLAQRFPWSTSSNASMHRRNSFCWVTLHSKLKNSRNKFKWSAEFVRGHEM